MYIMVGNNDSGTSTQIMWRDDCMEDWTLDLYRGLCAGGWSWSTIYVKKHIVMVF